MTILQQRDFFRFERMASRMFGRLHDKMFAVLMPYQSGTAIIMRQLDGVLCMRVNCNTADSIILPWQLVKVAAANSDTQVELQHDNASIILKHEVKGIPRQSRFDTGNMQAPEIPAMPDTMADVAAEQLFDSLIACGKCIDHDSERYALGYISLHGDKGTIAATDGRQALLVDGFEFPWDGEMLVPSNRVFAAKELRDKDTVQIGCCDQWVTLASGDFTLLWKSFEGRFPKVENIMPQTSTMTSWLDLDDRDAAFVSKRIDDMPGEKDKFRPVTLDLNGHVAVRSADQTGDNVAELLLANSRYTGNEVRATMTRDFLKHALSMGLKRIGLDTHKHPLLAVDGNRRFVWMPLTSEPVLRTEATNVVSSADMKSQSPVKPEAKVNPEAMPIARTKPVTPRICEHAPVLVTATKTVKPNVTASEERTVLDEAESLREALRTSLGQVNTLVRSLKNQMRQNRMLRSTLASIKRLQSLEA